MPEPPPVGLITRYVFENAWPLAVILLALGTYFGWRGLRPREGTGRELKIAIAPLALGAIVLLVGRFVRTSGEQARIVATSLVDSVVKEDLLVADAVLAQHCSLSIGSPSNPGLDKTLIMDMLSKFRDRYQVEHNSITALKAYSESRDAGEVHLACLTRVNGIPNASKWVMRIERQPDGSWQVTRLTCVSINDRTPPLELVR